MSKITVYKKETKIITLRVLIEVLESKRARTAPIIAQLTLHFFSSMDRVVIQNSQQQLKVEIEQSGERLLHPRSPNGSKPRPSVKGW